eukprot:gene5959-8212_t
MHFIFSVVFLTSVLVLFNFSYQTLIDESIQSCDNEICSSDYGNKMKDNNFVNTISSDKVRPHSKKLVTLQIRIPWPSGILVDKAIDNEGRSFRVGRIQHNTVRMRPQWKSIYQLNNLLSTEMCSNIIETAESYASQNGWSKGRHIDYIIRPTKDLSVSTIFSEEEMKKFMMIFQQKLFSQIAARYNINLDKLKVSDLFITKYEANTNQNGLNLHQDRSPWSFVIALNEDFVGGGTYFADSQKIWNPRKGGAVFFSGDHYHGGLPITEGIRYILAGFIEYGDNSFDSFMTLYNPMYDGFAAKAGFRTGDIIVGIQVCNESLVPCSENDMINNEIDCRQFDNSEIPHYSKIEMSRRFFIFDDISLSDEEWVAATQSCEILDHHKDTVLIVKRWVEDD